MQSRGDWYIYPELLAHEHFNDAHKNGRKSYTIFKLAYTISLAKRQLLQNMDFLVLYGLCKGRLVLWCSVQPPSFFVRRI